MSDKIDNGGSAFPLPPVLGAYAAEPGMTLLDWFAGQAMNGLYAGRPDGGLNHRDQDLDVDATLAYRIAGAMLRARAALKKAEEV